MFARSARLGGLGWSSAYAVADPRLPLVVGARYRASTLLGSLGFESSPAPYRCITSPCPGGELPLSETGLRIPELPNKQPDWRMVPDSPAWSYPTPTGWKSSLQFEGFIDWAKRNPWVLWAGAGLLGVVAIGGRRR